jgi:catechol 2,3-dioxygenase-like lactoylglutathione lyase family enzyme
MFKRIDHIELLTAAPERALAFYVGVLGFRERERQRIAETPSAWPKRAGRPPHPSHLNIVVTST